MTGASSTQAACSSLPILDLSWANDPDKKPALLQQLHHALFNIGFLYIVNHNVSLKTISDLASKLPTLFALSNEDKNALSKLNSPHFLGYSGFAEETTLGKQDLREQFDYATELPTVAACQASQDNHSRDLSKLYWQLRGPNQWPQEHLVPGFRNALTRLDA